MDAQVQTSPLVSTLEIQLQPAVAAAAPAVQSDVVVAVAQPAITAGGEAVATAPIDNTRYTELNAKLEEASKELGELTKEIAVYKRKRNMLNIAKCILIGLVVAAVVGTILYFTVPLFAALAVSGALCVSLPLDMLGNGWLRAKNRYTPHIERLEARIQAIHQKGREMSAL